MEYREFQRAHPEWPARLRDAVGRQVRPRRPLTRRDGVVVQVDRPLTIVHHHRGKLFLETPEPPIAYIAGVRPADVRLLPVGDRVSSATMPKPT
jgi:hypothetical protein